jgi:hypothetical protein
VRIVVATRDEILLVDPEGEVEAVGPAGGRPTCLAADPGDPARVWCGTEDGVRASADGGATWDSAGLEGEAITAIAASAVEAGDAGGVVYAGTEPSAVWRTADGGGHWTKADRLASLPSAPTWSFPPRPETHHVRWIACDPETPGRILVAIEAGALVGSPDGGRTWNDRPEVAPFDTHELAIHPHAPDLLRVAAGDGYWESPDGGGTWHSPEAGLDVTYLRSVAVDPGDPGVVLVSAASHPHSAYMAGRSDGRLFRRVGEGPWTRVREGWPDPPDTIAPLLLAGRRPGEIWAADERGVHRSADGGRSWKRMAGFDPAPPWLRGIALSDP